MAKTLAILPECYVILANCFHLATRRCKLIASSARMFRLTLNRFRPCAKAIVWDMPRADPPPVEKQSYTRYAQACRVRHPEPACALQPDRRVTAHVESQQVAAAEPDAPQRDRVDYRGHHRHLVG